MNVKDFIAGIEIIAKYDPSIKEASIAAEHEHGWVGSNASECFERMSEGDKKALDELIWFVDEDSWSFFC